MTSKAIRLQEELEHETSAQNYLEHLQIYDRDVIENKEVFTCPICYDSVPKGSGVVLRECLHPFCRDCLSAVIKYSEEAALKCPYQDEEYTCTALLQEREIRGLVDKDVFEKYLRRSVVTAESQAPNSYHCKTTDCAGWCLYEDLVNFFKCSLCKRENCLTCKAIHEGVDCKQYQMDLETRASTDLTANQTQMFIQNLLSSGEAMNCPSCHVVVQKKEGCDWLKCSICKTEICWVTKGPRWGPLGPGDNSGGCQCRVNGRCHPLCSNCH